LAHNQKVVGSNPTPATKLKIIGEQGCSFLILHIKK
jgi:hypothetical protein